MQQFASIDDDLGPARDGGRGASALRICLLSSMHPPRDKRVFDKEAIAFAAAGHEVTHLCPGEPSEAVRVSGVTIRTYPRPSGLRGRLRQLSMLYRMAHDEKADVLHCNEVDSWLVGVAVRLRHGGKCVFDVHEHYPSTFASSRFPRPVRRAVETAVRLLFRVLTPFTDRIVLAKRTVGPDFHCRPEKKVLVQNFTPLAGLSLAETRTPRRPDEPLKIVHLGLFGRERGWPQVLEAMTIARADVRLQVIGTINDGSEADFRERVAALGLSDRIEMLNWMPFDQAFRYLLEGHVGLIAFQPHILNHVYAMPHKLFDYMAAGMAVLIPGQAVEVAPIVRETGCGLLIDASDPADIAARIDELAADPGAAHEMGRRGREAVLETYNWEAEARKLIDMYAEFAERR